MEHCKRFKPANTIFLAENKDFKERRIKLGRCPICNKLVIELIERRKTDNKVFLDKKVGNQAEKILKQEKHNYLYKTSQLNRKKCLFGWRYGEGKVINNKTVYFAVDFYGNKKEVKT